MAKLVPPSYSRSEVPHRSSLAVAWQRASDLEQIQETPRFLPLPLPGISALRDGLKRGTILEIIGPRSSGRTACLLHILAQATQRAEICAFVDAHNRFDPQSAEQAGVFLSRLAWIRCSGNIEHAIRAVDLLVHAGGFGVIVLDLCETALRDLNQIPLSYWFRFRRALESTATVLLVAAECHQVKSSSAATLELKPKELHWEGSAEWRLFGYCRGIAHLRKPMSRRPELLTFVG